MEFLAALKKGFEAVVGTMAGYLYNYILVYVLVAVGIFLLLQLGAVQFRHARAVFRSLAGSRHTPKGEISSFQAFAVGLGTRVGIGNIAGVALALVVGGPGAIFWMWIIALLAMGIAFSEATLAQIFKIRGGDGLFRGGPAYYMERGLGWKVPGIIFAVVSIFASGLSVPMVQVNTVAATFESSHQIQPWVTGLVVAVMIAPVILGGLRSVARAAEYLTPIMAGIYLLMTIAVILLNVPAAGAALLEIVKGALGLHAAAGGIGGAIMAAFINGARRGLFSNEAGLGTAPNTAGTAAVAHPVSQGFLQALGVFVDTIVVCTCTALMILIAGPSVYQFGTTAEDAAGSLTANAVMASLGEWTALPVSIIIFIFCFTSAFGAYSYGQINLDLLTENKVISYGFRVLAVFVIFLGSVLTLSSVWALADLLLGLGALINLVALLLLGKWVRGAIKDWEAQKAARVKVPTFQGKDNPLLPGDVPGEIWNDRTQVAQTAGVTDLGWIEEGSAK